MNEKDIVKYVNGNTYYILESIDYENDIAFIKHLNGTIYKVAGIYRLEKSNMSYDEFYGKLDKERAVLPDLDGEVWKQCIGIDNVCVSNLGRVKFCNPLIDERLIKVYENGNGYSFIRLNVYLDFKEIKKNYNVAFLVATAFIPNPHGFKFINHNDQNPQNNNVSNLKWSKNGDIQLAPTKEDHINIWMQKRTNNNIEYNYNKDKMPIEQRLIEDGLDGFEDAIWNID